MSFVPCSPAQDGEPLALPVRPRGDRVARRLAAARRGGVASALVAVVAAEIALALALVALNVLIAAGGSVATVKWVTARALPLWQIGLVRFVALNACAAAFAFGLGRVRWRWVTWSAGPALWIAALCLNAAIAALGPGWAVQQGRAWRDEIAGTGAGQLIGLTAVWLVAYTVVQRRQALSLTGGEAQAWSWHSGALAARAAARIWARRAALGYAAFVALGVIFNLVVAASGVGATASAAVSWLTRSLPAAFVLAGAGGGLAYVVDRRDQRDRPLAEKLLWVLQEDAGPLVERHRAGLLVLVCVWLLLRTLLAGPITAVVGVPPGQSVFGTQLFLLYVVAFVMYRWVSRVAVGMALGALALTPFAQLQVSERAAEEVATFAYFMLCLGVGQGIWEMKRDGRAAHPSGDNSDGDARE